MSKLQLEIRFTCCSLNAEGAAGWQEVAGAESRDSESKGLYLKVSTRLTANNNTAQRQSPVRSDETPPVESAANKAANKPQQHSCAGKVALTLLYKMYLNTSIHNAPEINIKT